MKIKNIIFGGLALAAQISVLVYFTTYSLSIKKSTEKNGTIVSLPCTAYDPFDPFKGRYIRLQITEKNPYIEYSTEYYLQENFAAKVELMRNSDFNELKPELELYVDEKGRYVQKGMTVLPPETDSRISLEEYLRAKK